MANDVLKLLRLSYVPRWVIVPMSRPQTVADHTFRVALIALKLVESKAWSGGSIGLLLREALIHDAEEIYTGDIPSTAKLGLVTTVAPNLNIHDDNVPPQYKFIVKVADIVEAISWFKMYSQAGTRYSSILASMEQTFEGLKHHPNYDHDVYRRAQIMIDSGEIE